MAAADVAVSMVEGARRWAVTASLPVPVTASVEAAATVVMEAAPHKGQKLYAIDAFMPRVKISFSYALICFETSDSKR